MEYWSHVHPLYDQRSRFDWIEGPNSGMHQFLKSLTRLPIGYDCYNISLPCMACWAHPLESVAPYCIDEKYPMLAGSIVHHFQ